ncbi:uncharacterized protein LOC106074298 isoform X2 [Biomphalaria glabrata]|uniref:Uncharacterized protein LOC106074298 isoform X2 n=1 Tax=Biomphalaria glabrata TaxID=6526 RepID=A0A9W2ZDT7_BIOGL|nr:uncharacterized protein LOC106074298 isoform X2 [Biomphalaria glabrata]
MLLPYETYGTEFISFNILGRLSQGLVAVVASKNNTEVKLYTNNNGTTSSVFLQQTGDWVYLPVSGFNYYFKADKAIQVIYVHRSVCRSQEGGINEEDQGGPSLGLLLPMELFYDHFIWSTPFTEGNANFSNYATYVADANNIPYMRLDHNLLNITNWENVIGQREYRVGSLQVSKGLHTTFVITTSKFVCYVYGFADHASYMLAPNFISSPINLPCTRSVTFMMPGDLRDNDCDFFVDEEAFDNIDNDADGSIDEDLGLPNRGCGEYEYGRNCIGDCKLKCNSDCVERRHGTCPSYSSVAVTWVAVTAVMALSVPLCFLCSAMFSKKYKSFHDEPENEVVYAAITTTGSGLSSLHKGRTSIGSSIN